jgi:hypothetical protein
LPQAESWLDTRKQIEHSVLRTGRRGMIVVRTISELLPSRRRGTQATNSR